MKIPTRLLKRMMKSRGWKIFSGPWELNIVGIRSPHTCPNSFDDLIIVFFNDGAREVRYTFPATTDPGLHYLHDPLLSKGTAILAEQQALNAYAIGWHRRTYYALTQSEGDVAVIRDNDRDAVLDFHLPPAESGRFGINIHRARKVGSTSVVDRWSAGCQVFKEADHFAFFMDLCDRSRDHRKQNIFTYSLIDFRAIQRRRKGRAVTGLSIGLGLTLTGLVLLRPDEN